MFKTVRAVGVVAVLLSPNCAWADQASDAMACSAIADSLARLTCFDRVFPKKEAGAAAPNKAPEDATGGAWDITRDKSAIDDSPTIFASLAPTDTSGSGVGRSEMWLIARCSEQKTSVVFSTSMFMTDSPKVTIRLGDAPAKTSTWDRSSNYKATGLWSGAQAIPFLKSLKNNNKLAVRIEERERQDAVFNLGNVEAMTAEIAAACKWKS